MAVGQINFPHMLPIKGVSLGTANAGIKQNTRDDVTVIAANSKANCAAVFTKNAFCAAPIILAKRHLSQSPCWLLINSGNANAGTGATGLMHAEQSCQEIARLTGCSADQVLPFSTGVIGESLPVEKIMQVLPDILDNLSETHWQKAAHAIMTTDTFAKGASKSVTVNGKTFAISGISKGAGMIQPNMATMLAFIATDAKVAQPLLQSCLQTAIAKSFNRISVDGDTSTNDACVLIASGESDCAEITAQSEELQCFQEALNSLCAELSEAIVRDGEGATKLINIHVKESASASEALQVAKTVAHSPLVKTAFFASDPNWGRILAAVGRSDIEDMQIDKIQLFLDDVCIVRNGERAEEYSEQAGQKVMDKDEITISISLGRGNAEEHFQTCDLSYDYVKINAEYRT